MSQMAAKVDASTAPVTDAGSADGGDIFLAWSTAQASNGQPAPGAQICMYLLSAVQALGSGTPPPTSRALSCVTSGADGRFVIHSVPVRTNLVLTITSAGFVPSVRSIQSASSAMDVTGSPIFLLPTSTETDPTPDAAVDWQNKGQIVVFASGVSDVGDGGAGVSLSMGMPGEDLEGGIEGPFYQGGNNAFVPSATSFQAAGSFGVSIAEYFDVPTGLYTLTMEDPIEDCEPNLTPLAAYGFPVITPQHSIQVLVLNGYVSSAVGFSCLPYSVLVPVDGG
jgi:hypothetical protein